MTRKVAATILVLVVLIAGAFVALYAGPLLSQNIRGLCVGYCPGQAPLSVSQVSLNPGGSIQNQYVVGTFWDVVTEVTGTVNFAAITLNSHGVNGTGFSNNVVNGETVIPTSQIYVSLQELQPYAYITLVPQALQFAPNATGLGNPSDCGGYFCNGQTMKTNAQSATFYKMSGPWHFVYPVKVTVTKQASGGSQSWTQSEIINAATTNTTTIYSPLNSSQYVEVNALGLFKGSLSDPQIGNEIFLQTGSNGQGGTSCSNWCAFSESAIPAIQYQYGQYWYGSSQSFTPTQGEGCTYGGCSGQTYSPDPTYRPGGWSCPSVDQGHPGWAQTTGYYYGGPQENPMPAPNGLRSWSQTFWYAPLAPSLTNPQSEFFTTHQYENNGVSNATGLYLNKWICSGLDLVDWLNYNGYGGTFNYYGLPNWGNITNQQLTLNLPYGQNSPGYPTLQVLISSTLADTIVYQVNNAQFKITGLTESQASIYAGGTATVTATVQNLGNYSGTANVGYYQGTHVADSEPPTQAITLGPGQSGNVQFSVTGLQLTKETNDTLTYFVENSAGQITDSKSITLQVNPQPSAGSKIFVVAGLSGPTYLNAGQQGTLTVSIESLGIAGTANIASSSEASSVAQIAPAGINQSMGAGNTVQDQFTIVAGNPAKNTNVTLDISVSNGTSSTIAKYSLIIYASGCASNCGYNTPGGLQPLTYLAIGLVVLGVGALSFLFLKKRKK